MSEAGNNHRRRSGHAAGTAGYQAVEGQTRSAPGISNSGSMPHVPMINFSEDINVCEGKNMQISMGLVIIHKKEGFV